MHRKVGGVPSERAVRRRLALERPLRYKLPGLFVLDQRPAPAQPSQNGRASYGTVAPWRRHWSRTAVATGVYPILSRPTACPRPGPATACPSARATNRASVVVRSWLAQMGHAPGLLNSVASLWPDPAPPPRRKMCASRSRMTWRFTCFTSAKCRGVLKVRCSS